MAAATSTHATPENIAASDQSAGEAARRIIRAITIATQTKPRAVTCTRTERERFRQSSSGPVKSNTVTAMAASAADRVAACQRLRVAASSS